MKLHTRLTTILTAKTSTVGILDCFSSMIRLLCVMRHHVSSHIHACNLSNDYSIRHATRKHL